MMERWVTAIKDFFTAIEGAKTMSVFAICYWISRIAFNVAKTEILTIENIDLVVLATSFLGTISGYLLGRFDPYRKKLFYNVEHRIVWAMMCLIELLLIWFMIRVRFSMGMQ